MGQEQERLSYIATLRKELIYLIEKQLSPLALKYGYSEVALESHIKWKPLVLLLGNYSSGKSTLINELIGKKIQVTGQAPTDDCFTVITSDDNDTPAITDHNETITETATDLSEDLLSISEREGSVLLNDPEYPFEGLKKHGSRFSSHFKLLKVQSDLLKNLAIIDTPGMLDSTSENDRGFDYQEVIGDLAQLSDLILVMFDPHKAGTIRETHFSLKKTLPERTFEDRLIFVLNRVDECSNLEDLLRVYGTLCWNLSQMTGRKDIPHILLTCSQKAFEIAEEKNPNKEFLDFVKKQRKELHKAVTHAPKHRLDHLAGFVELHSNRLGHLLECLINYNKKRNFFMLKSGFAGFLVSLIISAIFGFYVDEVRPFGVTSTGIAIGLALGMGIALTTAWQILTTKFLLNFFKHSVLQDLESLTEINSQAKKDSFKAILPNLEPYIRKNSHRLNGSALKKEAEIIHNVQNKGAKEIRRAISNLGKIEI